MAKSDKTFVKGVTIKEETTLDNKKLRLTVNSGATASTTTTLESAQTANRTITLPDATDTLVAKQTTDTLENKTIDATAATGNNTLSMDASDAAYNNATSGLTATDVQAALDEIDSTADSLSTNKTDGPGTHADNIIPRFDGVNSNNLQTSGITVNDTDDMTGVNSITTVANIDVGGDLTVTGDLTVNGTTTTVNTTNMQVTDANILVNDGGTQATANSAAAGITVEMSDATDARIGYDSTATSKFKIGEVGSEVEIADISSSQVITSKDIDGGTASNTSRITVPKNTRANLEGLTRKQGTILYDTTNNQMLYDDGSSIAAIADSGSSTVIQDKTANYTALTTDDIVRCDTSSGGFTVTLPTGTSNKQIKIVKISTDFNALSIEPDTQTLAGQDEVLQLLAKGESVVLLSDASGDWDILSHTKKRGGNKFINGMFDLFQRTNTFTSTSTGGVNLVDRWIAYTSNQSGSYTISQETSIKPDDDVNNTLKYEFTSTASAQAFCNYRMIDRDSKQLHGKKISVGIYYRTSEFTEASLSIISANSLNNFGATTSIYSSANVAITNDNTWRLLVFEGIDIPTATGNAENGLQFSLNFKTPNTQSGTQTLYLAKAQCNIGNTLHFPMRRCESFEDERQACFAYYQELYQQFRWYMNGSGSFDNSFSLVVPMISAPTIDPASITIGSFFTGANGSTTFSSTANTVYIDSTNTSAASGEATMYIGTFKMDSEL